MIILIAVITFTILSAALYRLGGWGNEGRQRYPEAPGWLFNTKARDIGCPLVAFMTFAIMYNAIDIYVPFWVYAISFVLLSFSLSSYWDFLFGFDNHTFHGLMCGFSYLPYAIYTGRWVGFAFCIVIMAMLMGWVSARSTDDVVEETCRGGILIITLPLMLV